MEIVRMEGEESLNDLSSSGTCAKSAQANCCKKCNSSTNMHLLHNAILIMTYTKRYLKPLLISPSGAFPVCSIHDRCHLLSTPHPDTEITRNKIDFWHIKSLLYSNPFHVGCMLFRGIPTLIHRRFCCSGPGCFYLEKDMMTKVVVSLINGKNWTFKKYWRCGQQL
jgi:hypothetical protein